jgi:hypothetical protein
MKRTLASVLALVLLAGGFMGLKARIDRIPRRKIPGSSIIYIPSGKYLKMATFGFSGVLADLIYIWAIQYYGNTAIEDRYTHLTHVFSIISELDPSYVDPYVVGALIAVEDTRDYKLALKILDMGLAKNPGQWLFPFEAGHYAQLYLKDYALAKEYYKKTMEIPGAPDIARRLFAATAFKANDLTTAWETWREVYQGATDPQVRKIASNHLYQVKAALDAQAVGEACSRYRAAHGRNPAALEDLVRDGLMARVPKDLDDKDYLYDPATGEIKTQAVPWKR